MKSFVKAALGGLVAVTVSISAQAQTAQLESAALNAVKNNAVARDFMVKSLGVSATASLAEVNAAIGTLSAAQAAAVVNAFNTFAAKSAQASTTAAKDSIARSLFLDSKGQTLKVAALVNAAYSRGSINTSFSADSCGIDADADRFASLVKTMDRSEIKSLIGKGAVVLPAGCANGGLREMTNAEAVENVFETAKCMDEKGGMNGKTEDQYYSDLAGCLAAAKGTSENQLAAVKEVISECGIFPAYVR